MPAHRPLKRAIDLSALLRRARAQGWTVRVLDHLTVRVSHAEAGSLEVSAALVRPEGRRRLEAALERLARGVVVVLVIMVVTGCAGPPATSSTTHTTTSTGIDVAEAVARRQQQAREARAASEWRALRRAIIRELDD